MLRNYLKIAFRSLLKHRLYAGINIVGLALGMACALLIGLWVGDELRYNRFLPHVDDTFLARVNFNFQGGETTTMAYSPGPLPDAIMRDIPGVAAATKTSSGRELLFKAVGSTSGTNEQGHFVSDRFFEVFDLPILAGDPKTALAQPDNLVISRRLAEKLFGGKRAIGKAVQVDNGRIYTVGAVLENIPHTSTLHFDWLARFENENEPWMQEWGMNSFLTYVRLKPATLDQSARVAQAEGHLKNIYRRYVKFNNNEQVILQPLADLHLYGEYKDGRVAGGRIEYVRLFGIVALFILLIACINFMNLSTARSAIRAKEVGVRKVVGAGRASLMGQFLAESTLTSLMAVGLALLLTKAVLPLFNTQFDQALTLSLENPLLWGLVGGLVLVTGVLSGSYPALFLSGLQPVSVLKGANAALGLRLGAGRRAASGATFRRVLVVFQFALSVFLMVGMVVVGRQMHFLRTKNLGLDRENVLYIPLEGNLSERIDAFRQEVLRLPAVASATPTNHLPMNVQSNTTDLRWPGQVEGQLASVYTMNVGRDFVKTMNIKLLDGRDFGPNTRADSANYLINEAAAKLIGESAPGVNSPVGREITFTNGKGRVIGLMKDFHLASMHETIGPLVLVLNPTNTQYLLVKTRAGQTESALAGLAKLTRQFNPTYPFSYHFLDEAYERLYRAEGQVGTLVNLFGGLAILISCLGLFALAAFMAEQRTKEIGVRKVLGASVMGIVSLLSKDFLKLVLIALAVATPPAWWAADRWLGGFAYHTELTGWLFVLTGLLAVSIALLTVAYQSIRAALMNPVQSLRSE
ncbi:MAG: FtsX-like permease family protein [Cytophagales bacterium]|nr:MAG: FtsX-like permease family protein [Cytophagales bacterium]